MLLLSHIITIFQSNSIQFGLLRSIWFTLVQFNPLRSGSVRSVHLDPVGFNSVQSNLIRSILVYFSPLLSSSVHFDLVPTFQASSVHLGSLKFNRSKSVHLADFGQLRLIWSTSVHFFDSNRT